MHNKISIYNTNLYFYDLNNKSKVFKFFLKKF